MCYISANILSAAGSAFCSCISSKMLAVFCYKQLVQFKSGSPQEHPPALLRSQIESVFYVKIRFDSIQLSKSLHSCFIYHSLTCYFTQRSNFVLRPPFSHFTIQLIFFWFLKQCSQRRGRVAGGEMVLSDLGSGHFIAHQLGGKRTQISSIGLQLTNRIPTCSSPGNQRLSI